MGDRLSGTCRRLARLAVIAGLCGGLGACGKAPPPPADSPIELHLVAAGPAPEAGGPLWVAVLLELEPGWHVYWRHPGFSGLPIRVHVDVPAGARAGPVQWPLPTRFDYPGVGVDFGYEGSVGLPLQVTLPPAAAGTSQLLSAKVAWVACKSSCIPGQSQASLEVQVGEPADRPLPVLARWLARLPGPPPGNLAGAHATWGEPGPDGQRDLELRLDWHGEPPGPLHCFPILSTGLQVESLETETRGSTTVTRIRTLSRTGSAASPEETRLAGAVYAYPSGAGGERKGFQVAFPTGPAAD